MRKIGVLLPQSKAYQTLGKEFINGLKLNFNSEDTFIVEGIGMGNDVQLIMDRIDKMSLQDDVSVIVGLVGDNNLHTIYDKVNGLEVPTILVRMGAFPNLTLDNNQFAYTLSFGICDALQSLGGWFVKNGYSQVAMAGSFNDIGYGFSKALESSLYASGGEFAGHHVPPIEPRDNEAQLAEEFYTSTEFDIACELFNGDFAQENAEYISGFGKNIDKPFIFSPFGLTSEQLQLVSGNLEKVLMFASWLPAELRGDTDAFDQEYYQKYDKYPSIASLLGYEAHMLIENALDNRKELLSGENLSIESPRGILKVDQNLNVTGLQRVWEAETIDETIRLKTLETLAETKDTSEPFTGQENGWHNAYLCY